jgi:hypothetical protein
LLILLTFFAGQEKLLYQRIFRRMGKQRGLFKQQQPRLHLIVLPWGLGAEQGLEIVRPCGPGAKGRENILLPLELEPRNGSATFYEYLNFILGVLGRNLDLR